MDEGAADDGTAYDDRDGCAAAGGTATGGRPAGGTATAGALSPANSGGERYVTP